VQQSRCKGGWRCRAGGSPRETGLAVSPHPFFNLDSRTQPAHSRERDNRVLLKRFSPRGIHF
jgi:hypothetical protein